MTEILSASRSSRSEDWEEVYLRFSFESRIHTISVLTTYVLLGLTTGTNQSNEAHVNSRPSAIIFPRSSWEPLSKYMALLHRGEPW